MKKMIGVAYFFFLIFIALCGWFFTLLVDNSMLIVLGFVFSFITYRVFVRRYWMSLGVYSIFLLPLNIIALWVGGTMPYWNIIPPESVYFNLLPKEWLGNSGNDFMWNGLLLPIIGRVIPENVIPTTRYTLFTVYAIFVWATYAAVLTASSCYGYSMSVVGTELKPDKNFVTVAWYNIFFVELLKMCLLAVATFVLLSSLALGIARIYV